MGGVYVESRHDIVFFSESVQSNAGYAISLSLRLIQLKVNLTAFKSNYCESDNIM